MSSPHVQRRWLTWCWLLALLLATLWAFIWAAPGHHVAVPWQWSAGWLLPAPSIVNMWLTGAAAFALLSGAAYLLQTTPVGAIRLPAWASGLLLILCGLVTRIGMTPAIGTGSASFRLLELLAMGLLLLTLWRLQRSAWWALLWIFHPLVLAEPRTHVLPLLALVPLCLGSLLEVSWTRPRIVTRALWLLTCAGTLLLAILADGRAPADLQASGAVADILAHLLAPPALLPWLRFSALAAVLALAWRAEWSAPCTLGHLLVVNGLFSAVTAPASMSVALAAAVLCWNPAAWIASLTAMAFWALPLAHGLTGVRDLPDWLVVLAWTPVAVVEAWWLIRSCRAIPRP